MRTTTIIILWHPATGFAFQFRDKKAPYEPNKWATFGGEVEDCEDVEESMWRELEEEVGLTKEDIDCVKYLGTATWQTDTQHIYALRMSVGIEHIHLREGAGIGWFTSLGETTGLNWGFNFRELIPKLSKTLTDPSAFFSDERTGQGS